MFDEKQALKCIEACEKNSCCEARVQSELSKLMDMHNRLDRIIETSYDGIYITDGKGETLKVNKAYEKLTNIKREQLIGSSMRDLEKQGIISKSATLIALKNKAPVTLEQWINHEKKLLVTSNPLFSESGEIEMVVTNVRDVTELEQLQQTVTKTQEMINEMQKQLLRDQSIVINDPKSKVIIEMANRIAMKHTTVMISGETGTGKEVLAKYIHNNSMRAKQPFISVNCGAIPEQLIESELFGYEKGAFTGANPKGKPGIFELADGGTLFLDEIGELPLSMQVKLLRALQEGEVQRVGGLKVSKIDIRLITATNRNLYQMMQEGTFREDLYYRLNIVPIKLLALRERTGDIVPLANHFLKSLNDQYNDKKIFTGGVLDIFSHYTWPGNVRQIKNIVERCYVMSQGSRIEESSLPIDIRDVGDKLPGKQGLRNIKDAVAELEKGMIKQAFEKYGNVRHAAAAIGIDPSTFVRKRKKYQEF